MESLSPEFFTRDPVVCARELVGCEFHWKNCSGRIVETEAYRAVGDEACHTFFRPSVRNFVASCDPGDAYVYLNYGVHWLFNIVVKGEAGDGFVLLRALEPIAGIERMRERRGTIPDKLLTAGPGRLTQALGIDREDNGVPFLKKEHSFIFRGRASKVVAAQRIGISKARDLPWRFGDPNSKCLSKKL